MTTLNVTEARANLYKLIDDTIVNNEPVGDSSGACLRIFNFQHRLVY